MQDTGLVAIPLPLLTSLLGAAIAVLMLRLDLGRPLAGRLFAALFALLSFSSALVALRFGYGVEQLILVQRLTPLLVGPLLYLAFAAFAVQKEDFPRKMGLHLGAALILLIVMLSLPMPLIALDWIISASYLFYIVLLYLLWRKGSDALIHAYLGTARTITNWMLRGMMLLASILLLDTAIALDFMLNDGRNASAMISFASIPIIFTLLAFVFVLPSVLSQEPGEAQVTAKSGSEEVELEARARQLLTETELYLEPDLSVQRIARRLHVPVRALSNAINQTQGMNVSQYVNGFRLEHAADLLRGTDQSVAKVMMQSGFLTRSNFYREFQRRYGESPAAYRDGAQMLHK